VHWNHLTEWHIWESGSVAVQPIHGWEEPAYSASCDLLSLHSPELSLPSAVSAVCMTKYCMIIKMCQSTDVEHGCQRFANSVLLSCGHGKLCINCAGRSVQFCQVAR